MKLSQKLLALGGVTLADYACCPYDDYGMPHGACTTALPEKTPFSMEDNWINGACKAWESNVDATYDGNDNGCETNENWGSCGFQRHFPWNQIDTEDFRNRGCEITYDSVDHTTSPLPATWTLNNGCHCQGLGDATTGAIVCKTNRIIAETTTASSTCTVYDPADNTSDVDFTDVCCNPSLAAGTKHTQSDGVTEVDVSCPGDVVTTCGADDLQALVDQGKLKCYETDFLGRRNIQSQKLFIKDAAMYDDPASFTAEFSYSSVPGEETGSSKNAELYNLAGVPFLGGVCKLYVPVPRSRITSVQIAGVHVSLDGPSVFAAKVGASANYDAANPTDDVGTAYCFSVVNPAEGMNNDNNIHNGNVAGGFAGTNSVFDQLAMDNSMTSLTRQAGIEPEINFFDGSDSTHIGTQLENGIGGSTASGNSVVGANFDVVVHIHSEWCNSQTFWNYADMQLAGDYNDAGPLQSDVDNYSDYPLNNAPGNDQRTAAAYSLEQVQPLQLQQLRQTVTDKQTLEDAAQDAYEAAQQAAFFATTCGTALLSDVTCKGHFDAFELAYLAFKECEIVNGVGQCTDEATALSDAQDEIMEDDNNDGTFNAGCLVVAPISCTANLQTLVEFTNSAIFTGLDTVAAAMAETTNAENARDAALQNLSNNGFTHAHMDLMDKRNDAEAQFNGVYQKDPNNSGYLRFPSGEDDYFVDANGDTIGNGGTGTYATAAENLYLRWPNAGAFAAFYSFVTCANPPNIADETIAAEVNQAAFIYSNGAAPNDPTDNTNNPDGDNAYKHLGNTILTGRTLVMSQSDSDYRDENCDGRTFRGNLRQVGNEVTVCGPGQLPDTDGKRCTWNWNYNSHAFDGTHDGTLGGKSWNAPNAQGFDDAEEWFDRNDPHSFDMWSTRKRRAAPFANDRKFAFNMGYWGTQEGKDGDTNNMFDGETFNVADQFDSAAIQIPISDFTFNLVFKNAAGVQPPSPVVSVNPSNCFNPAVNNCVCRPHYSELIGFETNVQAPGTATAIEFGANYDAETGGFDFSVNFDATSNVAHSSCTGDGSTDNSNGVRICTDAEAANIRANLDRQTLGQACFGYKADNTAGFFQTDNNPKQSLAFDDDRVVTGFNHEGSDDVWEVALRCAYRTEFDMTNSASNIAQRDFFPDCFFGDELWFTFSYSTSNTNGDEAFLQYNSYVSSWTSEWNQDAQTFV